MQANSDLPGRYEEIESQIKDAYCGDKMLIANKEIIIRKLNYCDEDFGLLDKWLNDPEVLKYYEGPISNFTQEKIIKRFGPRALGQSEVIACIFEYKELPVGYLQFYPLDDKTKNEFKISGLIDVYGIDLFIGETRFWNQGIGTKTLELMIQYLFQIRKAKEIFIDPQTWNTRAIRCYEKCGFKAVMVLSNHEEFNGELKDNLIMKVSLKE